MNSDFDFCACAKRGLLIAFAMSVLGTCESSAQLRITEVMYDPIDDSVWEWIEVKNFGSQPVNLDGYLARRLGDNNVLTPKATINSSLDPDTSINAGEVAIIYDGVIAANNPNNFTDDYFRQAWGLSPTVKLIGADSFPILTNTPGSAGQSIGFWATAADWRADQAPVELDPVNMPGEFTDVTTSFAHAAFSLDFSSGFPAAVGQSIAWSGIGDNQAGANWYTSAAGFNGAVTSSQVSIPGPINSDQDIGNPGIAPPGVAASTGLLFTEFMHDPDSPEDDWEWIEIYNSGSTAVSLAGYTLDDDDSPVVSAPNIASGNIAAGGTAILFNADDVSAADFAAAWGTTLNLVPVTSWNRLSLANSGDAVTLNNSFGMTVASQSFVQTDGFPNAPEGSSLSLKNLAFDPAVGSNWIASETEDLLGSFAATLVTSGEAGIPLHLGGDVGSPGTFISAGGSPLDGDFDGDGDVDGRDFLAWQRGDSPSPLSQQDLALWQNNFGAAQSFASSQFVPEPITLVWPMIVPAGLILTRKARGRHLIVARNSMRKSK